MDRPQPDAKRQRTQAFLGLDHSGFLELQDIRGWAEAVLEDSGTPAEDATKALDVLTSHRVAGCAFRKAQTDDVFKSFMSVGMAFNESMTLATAIPKLAPAVPAAAKAQVDLAHWRDKLPWEFQNADLAEYVDELLSALWKNVDEGVAVLELKKALGKEYTDGGCALVVRSSVRQLWRQAINKLNDPANGISKVAMLGNPGIGKSRSLFYGLRLLMGGSDYDDHVAGPRHLIIMRCTQLQKVFAFVPPGQDLRGGEVNTKYHVYSLPREDFKEAACMALQKEDTVYMVDPGAASKTIDMATVAAATILACSLDPDHYQEWAKALCAKFYVPVYTLPELLKMIPYIQRPEAGIITEDLVRERFRDIGGIPRVIFAPETEVADHLDKRERQLNNSNMIQQVIEGDNLETIGERMPTYLFAYMTPASLKFHERCIAFVSDGTRRAIYHKCYDFMMKRAFHLMNQPSDRGFKFEDFCGWLLTDAAHALGWQAAKLKCKSMALGGSVWVDELEGFTLPQHRLQQCDTVAQMDRAWTLAVGGTEPGNILRAPAVYTGIDYLLDSRRGVSAATSMSHEIAPEFYTKLAQAGCPPDNFVLIFFVPAKGFDKFKVVGTSRRDVQVWKVSIPMTTNSLVGSA